MPDLELIEYQPPKPPDHLLNMQEVAEMLNVTVDWVKNHSTRTKPLLPSVKIGDGVRRYRRLDIVQFIDDHVVKHKRHTQ